ncbi:HD-GYP domain-containing protein (c-di-GMP phosphodiesterase class II) [Ruminiclostridium sufflavum DSM 19573]|uniref:HD-GYP domain-containing protein (C-di-GMP phosphodiesterase class II) n=1 Tax=Ruminiclostridium sufflavum DSM 19573 TaxID=1121337 RepID=A0A318XML6_9FIRM|nr:HD-GYP domain-containing protein [Ruminiclostridium sufflavum]PYG88771.1 HD-GYP domain-containing protein (c-di-GMP phosphodiesterase class II) [Ruminiclostridium sufflavum DSM 19573]
MRKISTSNCKAGMIVGKAILHNGAAVLLEAGARLTASYINRLINLGITEIYIKDDVSKDIDIPDVIEEKTRLEAIELVKSTMEAYYHGDKLNSDKIIEVVIKIVNEILLIDDIIINLMDIKSCDNYTFLHSVNVCVLSIVTGVELKLSYDALKELGIGAILHDIGKVMIPPEILQKSSALTDEEYEVIKQHSLLGYNIIKTIPEISEASAMVALCHHERFDGKGYISGLKRNEIHIYSRIVAVADIFDALTSDRIYRKKISTIQAIDYLTVIAASSLDEEVLRCFAKIIPPFPVGTGIVLNNGEKGVVIGVNRNLPSRPVVRIVFSSDGNKKSSYNEINLAKETEYFIKSTAELTK